MKTSLSGVTPYITKDGSEIRELLHPNQHRGRNQSLAEAVIPPGTSTQLHRHHKTEEIYHVTRGSGRMTLGEQQFEIMVGDSINDILAARNASVPSIGVTFGYTDVPMAELEPDVVIDDFAALTPDLVGRLLTGRDAAA